MKAVVNRLNAYASSLPEKLMSDLGDKIVAIYNAFNRNDAEQEKIAKIKLPMTSGQRLEVAFTRDPDVFYDALHILSEGHIRCVGLAILLAKNLKEDCPILIFDDPVNAIDDDHKNAIRRTLFEDDFFANTQIILTCHGEEFFKDIQNLLPAKIFKKDARSIAFLPRNGDPNIRVDFNCAPRNYIIAARSCLDKNEVRDALAKGRQALEVLTKDKLWKYARRHGAEALSIQMRSATSPIELRGLAEQLRIKISKVDNASLVLGPLDLLLGPNGNSPEWRYLNKGTHEEQDRSEFERETVDRVVTALENLDEILP